MHIMKTVLVSAFALFLAAFASNALATNTVAVNPATYSVN